MVVPLFFFWVGRKGDCWVKVGAEMIGLLFCFVFSFFLLFFFGASCLCGDAVRLRPPVSGAATISSFPCEGAKPALFFFFCV